MSVSFQNIDTTTWYKREDVDLGAIELDGLTKDYGEVLAADDLTFAVESGEILKNFF